MEEKRPPSGSEVGEYDLIRKADSIHNGDAAEGEVEVRHLMLPMRDGVHLSTDIYFPLNRMGEGRLPVLIARSPYNKKGARKQSTNLALQGYIVIAQDVRGRYESEGVFYPFSAHADGYDTIEWAASQPWCDGSVGTFGASALGVVQYGTALLQPPHLKAMFVEVACADLYHDLYYQGGAFKQMGTQGWMNAMNILQAGRLLPEHEAQQAIETMTKRMNELMDDLQEMHTPLSDFPYLTRWLMPAYLDVLRLESFDVRDPAAAWFDSNSIMNKLDQIKIPVYHIGGFMDTFATGTLKAFVSLQHRGGSGAIGRQKLLMGPWTHATYGRGGDPTPWEENAQVDITEEMVRWFDYWLKNKDNKLMQEHSVRYYMTGRNTWETASDWPPPGMILVPYYLSGETSGTVSSLNDGSLFTQPPEKEDPDRYAYNPMKPVPTIGGNNGAAPPMISGPQEQSIVEGQVLTYTTELLDEDTALSGPVQAVLYVSSSAVDTDFTVKLTDVDENGTSIPLTDGIVRAKFREGQEKAVWLEPGQIYELKLEDLAVSHVFRGGHRIRVQIASSNYPKYNRNLGNTQSLLDGRNEDAVIALNTIYHDREHPSRVLLPIVPNH